MPISHTNFLKYRCSPINKSKSHQLSSLYCNHKIGIKTRIMSLKIRIFQLRQISNNANWCLDWHSLWFSLDRNMPCFMQVYRFYLLLEHIYEIIIIFRWSFKCHFSKIPDTYVTLRLVCLRDTQIQICSNFMILYLNIPLPPWVLIVHF